MDNLTLTKYLKEQGKAHLKCCFTNLLDKESFDQDLFEIDLQTLEKQYKLFENLNEKSISFHPFTKGVERGDLASYEIGIQAAADGKCGCLLLAGGQGTRLNFSKAKGIFPITLIKQKSLFQVFAEKVVAASNFVNKALPLAIMTSPLNEEETFDFFKKNNFFGLQKNQVFIFSQTMLPMLDFNGSLIASSSNSILKGPDGNGSCFKSFFQSGVGDKWMKTRVEYLNTVLIDNVLADPFDFELLGHLIKHKNEVALKSCRRINPKEKVGVIVESKKLPIVIEYNEIPDQYIFENEPYANLSMLTYTLNFAQKMSEIDLPLHRAKKKATFWDLSQKKRIKPNNPNIWKYERYIFDALPYSKSTSVLIYPRSEIFSPLKNLEGEDSVAVVQKDLLLREKIIFEKVTEKKAPPFPFEINPQFYYPTQELIARWKNKEADSPYLF